MTPPSARMRAKHLDPSLFRVELSENSSIYICTGAARAGSHRLSLDIIKYGKQLFHLL